MPSTLLGTIDALVDLNHNNAIDMVKAANDGIVAVIHKASESASFKDSAYIERRAAALDAGLLWGAYHFSSGRDAVDQFNNFMAAADWEHLADETTLLCLDFEKSSKGPPNMSLAQAHDFVTRVKNKTGRWPMIYGGDLIRDSVPAQSADDVLRNCPLWYANYRDQPKGIPVKTWPDFTLWQYTDGNAGPDPHTVDGMGRTDRNCFRGTVDDLRKQWPFANYYQAALSK
jgi:lysozyme